MLIVGGIYQHVNMVEHNTKPKYFDSEPTGGDRKHRKEYQAVLNGIKDNETVMMLLINVLNSTCLK